MTFLTYLRDALCSRMRKQEIRTNFWGIETYKHRMASSTCPKCPNLGMRPKLSAILYYMCRKWKVTSSCLLQRSISVFIYFCSACVMDDSVFWTVKCFPVCFHLLSCFWFQSHGLPQPLWFLLPQWCWRNFLWTVSTVVPCRVDSFCGAASDWPTVVTWSGVPLSSCGEN